MKKPRELTYREKTTVACWKAHWTSTQIGTKLGISKNAVVGIVYRLRKKGVDLPERAPPPVKIAARPARQPQVSGVPVAAAHEPAPRAPTPPPQLPPLQPLKVPFEKLRPRSCRYPFGDRDFLFCGASTDGVAPYCTEHRQLCYTTPQVRTRTDKRIMSGIRA